VQSPSLVHGNNEEQLLSHLDINQRAAVTHEPAAGALLVVAGPGSGKTRVIVERVNYLVSHFAIKPSQILCLTFSDKGAKEMQTRIERELKTRSHLINAA